MRKLLVGEARHRASRLRYFLLEGEPEEPPSYGVGIELKGETAEIVDLSPSRRKVEALARTLVRGTVTPVALRDVVDDWLLE